MRNAVIDRQFQHFRIDHDQPALVGPQPINKAEDHGVDRDRFARAGGAGDQKMRHAREIDDHRFAADGLAETKRQPRAGAVLVDGHQDFAQKNLFACRIRQFDADGVAALHDCDAARERAHRARDVVGKPDDARRLDARRRLEFVERDHRTRPRVDDFAAHAEVFQHVFERAGIGLDLVFRQRRAGCARHREQIERRQYKAAGRLARLCRRGGACARGRARHRNRALVVFLLVIVFVFELIGFRICIRRKSRLDPPRGTARHGCRRGFAEQPGQREDAREPRAEAQERMHEITDRNRGAFFVAVIAGLGLALDGTALDLLVRQQAECRS